MTDVLNRAHTNGVKVVLTVTMMAWDTAGYNRMRTFLGSSTARARLTTQIVDAVRSRRADGVNLDFEMVPTDMKAPYTAFVRQVKAAPGGRRGRQLADRMRDRWRGNLGHRLRRGRAHRKRCRRRAVRDGL